MDPLFDDREEPKYVHSLYESDIANFYCGTKVFITGGTGFLGRVLVEKLLRSCPGLDKVYLLIRSKKGKDSNKRFEELFEGSLYNKLKCENPSAFSKVVLINGDCAKPDLDLSLSDHALLIQEVNIVFHMAATVRFDEKLRTAVAINVQATRDLLKMSRQMTGLKAFIHMSSAYSNCHRKEIDEKFYPPALSRQEVVHLVKSLDDYNLDILTPILLGPWPNTYAYTKAIAEDVLREEYKDMPIGMMRPSVVVCTYKEPEFGWINNVYGATGVFTAAGVGLLKTLHCNPDVVADMVPVDMSTNATIASAWDVANTWKSKADKNLEMKAEDIPIYNYVSSAQQPITWGKVKECNEWAIQWPSVRCIWYYCFKLNKYRTVHNIYILFLHLLPAALMDLILVIIGKKTMMWKAYKKIHRFTDVISYFSTQEWKFDDSNVHQLWNKLNARDQLLFNFNIASIDWEFFLSYMLRGVRLHLIQEKFDNLDHAMKRYNKLRILHYFVVTMVTLLLLRLSWQMVFTLVSSYLTVL